MTPHFQLSTHQKRPRRERESRTDVQKHYPQESMWSTYRYGWIQQMFTHKPLWRLHEANQTKQTKLPCCQNHQSINDIFSADLEYAHILDFPSTRKPYSKCSSDLDKTENFKCPTIWMLKTVLFWNKHNKLLIGFKILIFLPY